MPESSWQSALGRLAIGALALAPGIVAPPVRAIPPPPREESRFGPVTQCIAGYRVKAVSAEEVSVGNQPPAMVGDPVSLRTRAFLVKLSALTAYSPPSWTPVALAGLGTIERGVIIPPPLDRGTPQMPISRSPEAERLLTQPIIVYRLPVQGANPQLFATSYQFKGDDSDLAILSRIAPVNPTEDTCGEFGPPDFANRGDQTIETALGFIEGPVYRCQNGIGFPVLPGEKLMRGWGLPQNTGSSILYTGGARLSVTGFDDPGIFSQLRAQGIRFKYQRPTPAKMRGRGNKLLAADYVASLESHRTGYTELVLSPRRNNPSWPWLLQIHVQFADGNEAQARALAERLEVIEMNDPRCAPF